jgi:predicted membrane-bound dolichyl-phosphate-mannose-protein mannosyltransferase
MNFKPSVRKIIVILVIAIIVFMLAHIPLCKPGGECGFTLWPGLISFIITYIIWSLFQKKESKDKVRGKNKK